MPESVLQPPAARDAITLADWVESTMAIEGEEFLPRAVVRRRLGADGNQDEAAIGLLLSEIRRRRKAAPTIYPFEVDASGVVRAGGLADPLYDLMVMLSLLEAPFRQHKQWDEANTLMDGVAELALGQLFGPNTNTLRFGWPVSDGRPSDFPKAIRWLAEAMGLEITAHRRTPRPQDGGVDVVAWRPFPDARQGFPVVLAQCTYRGDFRAKGTDINARRWLDWISFGSEPLSALVIPHIVDQSDEVWTEISYDVQVILDRFRICQLLSERTNFDDLPLLANAAAWLATQWDALRIE